MNSNVQHDLEDFVRVAEQITNGETCFWNGVYKLQQVEGRVEDWLIEQGCYLCAGKPYHCEEYTAMNKVIRDNYQSFMELI